jgi:hypothetical protein
MQVTAQQVYQQVLAAGGTSMQAEVGAALVSGIESDGDPTELSGGVGPAAGLFQFEPGTWTGNGGGAYSSVAQNATWQQQVQVFVNASKGNNFQDWGPDLSSNAGNPNSASNPDYKYSGPPQAGSKVANWLSANGNALVGGQPLPQAVAGGAAGASTGSAAQSETALSPTGDNASITLPGSTLPGFDPNAQTEETNSSMTTAMTQLEGNLQAYGFNANQVGALAQWAWGEATQSVDPTQIAIDLQTPGTKGYEVFQQVFPGFVQANAQLNAKGQGALSVQQYVQYQTQAEQAASAAGLPAGFINSQNIGLFIGQGISPNELSQRITDAQMLAYQSTPEQQLAFNQYFGVQDFNGYLGATQNGQGGLSIGQIASIMLDPITAEPLLRNQIAAAQLGGAASTAGIGAISEGEAMAIAQTYGTSTSTGGTAQPGLSQSQIQTAIGNVVPYAPLESARPGMGGEAAQGVISPDQLIGTQLLPTASNVRQLQTAEEVGKAPFSGGGGFVTNTKGTGTGSASSSGAGQ